MALTVAAHNGSFCTQLHSSICAVIVFGVTLLSTINVWSVLLGPIWEWCAYIFVLGRFVCIMYILACVAISALFRLLIDLVWKRIPPINEDFFYVFLVISNLIVATYLGLFHLATGEGDIPVFR